MNPVEKILKYSDPGQIDVSQEYLDRMHNRIMNEIEHRQMLPPASLVATSDKPGHHIPSPKPSRYTEKIKSWLEQKITPPKGRPNSTLMVLTLTLLSLTAISGPRTEVSSLEANLQANRSGETGEVN